MRHHWTHGPGSDIKAKAAACKLWEKRQGPAQEVGHWHSKLRSRVPPFFIVIDRSFVWPLALVSYESDGSRWSSDDGKYSEAIRFTTDEEAEFVLSQINKARESQEARVECHTEESLLLIGSKEHTREVPA